MHHEAKVPEAEEEQEVWHEAQGPEATEDEQEPGHEAEEPEAAGTEQLGAETWHEHTPTHWRQERGGGARRNPESSKPRRGS